MHQDKVVCSCGKGRYELAFRLSSLCNSSQHSKEPSEEVFHAKYRQEMHTNNTWIIKNHAGFSDRKNASGQSLSPIMYKGIMVLHYCVKTC